MDNSTPKNDGDSTRPSNRSPLRSMLILALILFLIGAGVYWKRSQSLKAASMPDKDNPVEKQADHEESGHHDEEGEHHEQEEGGIVVNEEMAQLVGIKVEAVLEDKIETTLRTTGKVVVNPNNQAIVGAKVDGRVVRVFVEPGQSVKEGQILAIVDSPQIAELRGQLIETQAKSKLAEQKRIFTAKNENRATMIQAKNKLDLASSNYERKQRLASLGATSQREVAEAETDFKNAKAEYEYQSSIKVSRDQLEAESELEQIQASVARLKHSLAALGASTDGEGGTINVTSPISGIIVDRHISVGEAVAQDKELMTVMNVSKVIIEAQLGESQAQRVQVGQPIIARIPGSQEVVEGQVQSIGITVDPEKRTVAVRSQVSNPHFLLRHEMSIDVSIVVGESKNALVIPISALVDEEGIKVVYIKEAERYERRPVTVGTINYRKAEILSGIKAGEEVVVTGAYQLANMGKGGGEGGEHDDD